MNVSVKKMGIIISVIVLLVLGLLFGAYQCGAANTRNNLGAEGRAAEISRTYTELGDEQRANERRLERDTDLIKRIIGITEAADRDARKLRESNRRSGDLLSLLEQEVDLLENYLNSMQRELAGYRGDSAAGNTAVEVAD